MNVKRFCKRLLIGTASLPLAACGGGGDAGVESIPPPPPTSPPPQGAAVTIFSNPIPGMFASVSTSAPRSGSGSALTLGDVSKNDADQVHIRYSSGGYYEIQMPGAAWDTLIFAKGSVPQDPAFFNYFQPQSAPQNSAFLATEIARTQGYRYSELGAWFDGRRVGEIAFGFPTAAGQVPVTGSASYSGMVRGTSDVVAFDSFDGYYLSPVTGTVQLGFDFAKGTLDGSMNLSLSGVSPSSLGTVKFTNTVFSAGSTSYSGTFDTSASGQNYFFGQFTGPHAEETIGAWALPFQYGGAAHQALGAWIAKKP
jgi:hypothetical protein